jgi:hypothetical protein
MIAATGHTLNSVGRQLEAMNCDRYKIGILYRANKTMINKKSLAYKDIINMVQWLKFENLNGKDIFISQDIDVDRALVLVDDLSGPQVEKMTERGVGPACVVETSPANFQAWVSFGMEAMPKPIRKIIAVALAREFGGDPASVDALHYGRLAGFTNRKPQYLKGSGFPYVKCRASGGEHAEKSDEVRAWAIRKHEKEEYDNNIKTPVLAQLKERSRQPQLNPELAFAKYIMEWLKQVNAKKSKVDLSRGDFAVACRMLKEGYLADDIALSMTNKSPDILIRKASHVDDYVTRTVKAAYTHITLR